MGVDIGSASLKVIEVGRKGQQRTLENYGELELTVSESSLGRTGTFAFSDSEIARALKIVCEEAGIQTKEVNFALPDFGTFFTAFSLPVMSKEELSEAVRYESRPYIPLPLSDIVLDWTITSGEAGKTPVKVLVVAVPNEVIAQYQNISRIAQLTLKSLEPEVFALARSALDPQSEMAAILDIGARSTNCTIVEKGVIKSSHSFGIGSNELTHRLAKSLNIGYNEAKDLQIKNGLAVNRNIQVDGKASVRDILIPLVDSIVDESKKIFRDFYQEEGKEPRRIILAGGLAHLPGFKEYLYTEFKKDVEIANPFSRISYPPPLKTVLEEKGSSYAVALGAALKGFE